MEDANLNLDIVINSEKAMKQIKKTTEAVDKLRQEINKLNNININVSVVEIKSKWWQFWK